MTAVPALHRQWLDAALPLLQADPRMLAAGAMGSWLRDEMDDWSDLDLVILVQPDALDGVLAERDTLARRLGPLLHWFSGEHVGAPELVIALYGPPLLHVDLKFTTAEAFGAQRVENPAVLWERDGELTAACATGAPHWPAPDPQWLEDRFWTWVHYTALKIARGEGYEVLAAMGFLRERVLAPLALATTDAPPQGVRRLEQRRPDLADALAATVAGLERASQVAAVRATIALYRQLRDAAAPPDLVRRTDVEAATLEFFENVAGRA